MASDKIIDTLIEFDVTETENLVGELHKVVDKTKFISDVIVRDIKDVEVALACDEIIRKVILQGTLSTYVNVCLETGLSKSDIISDVSSLLNSIK
jgi:hypothetical protein